MIRRSSPVLVGLVLVLTVAGCGQAVGGSGTSTLASPQETTTTQSPGPETTVEAEPATLVVWADQVRAEPLRELAAAFTESTGIPVEIQVMGFQEIHERVPGAVSSGEGPDLFVGAHEWTGGLVEAGIVRPIDLGGKRSDFLEVAVRAFGHGGTTFGLPYTAEAVGVFHNRDLVDEARSFLEVRSACGELEESEESEGCFGIPAEDPVEAAYYHYPFLSAYGGYVFAFEDGTYDPSVVGVDDEGALRGGRFLGDLISEGMIPPPGTDVRDRFLDGALPYWMAGLWELSAVRDSGLDWGVAVLPTMEGNDSHPFVAVQGLFVSAGANEVVVQSFLLDFLATPEAMGALHGVDPRVPVYRPVFEQVLSDEHLGPFARSVEQGEPIPNIPEMADAWSPLGEAFLTIRAGETGSQEALEQAAQRIREAVED